MPGWVHDPGARPVVGSHGSRGSAGVAQSLGQATLAEQ